VKSPHSLRLNWFGIASILSTLAFRLYAFRSHGNFSVYLDVAFVGILTLGIPASALAAWRGSKLWLITLLGPLWGWLFILTLSRD